MYNYVYTIYIGFQWVEIYNNRHSVTYPTRPHVYTLPSSVTLIMDTQPIPREKFDEVVIGWYTRQSDGNPSSYVLLNG